MAIQSAVACSEAKDDGLLVSWQLMESVLVWVVSSNFEMEDGFLFITDKSFRLEFDSRVSLRIISPGLVIPETGTLVLQ